MGYYRVCVSHLGFLEPESPNFGPNHAFLSSIEAEIITFLPKKAAILFFLLLRPSFIYFNVAPLPELIVRLQRPLIPKMLLLSALYRVCGLAVTAGIAMKFGTAHGRSRLGVGGAKCIGSYGRKGVVPAPCNFGAS